MYDIISIGSSTVDVLAKTKNEIRKHEHHIDIAYHLGEKILIDDLVFSTGGGGTNCAVAFSRLGLKTAFIGAVGNDINGAAILKDLKKEGVDFKGKVKSGNSGYAVILPGSNDRTILVHKGVNNSLSMGDIDFSNLKTKWVYLSTLLGEGLETQKKLVKLAKEQKSFVAINISMYLAKTGIKSLSSFLRLMDIIILNKEEAQTLTSKKDIDNIFSEFFRYTNAIVVITNGQKDVYSSDGNNIFIKKIKPIKPVDTTGAGDAFASGFVYGIMKGKDIPTSLDYGHKEALAVLGYIGAKNNLVRKL